MDCPPGSEEEIQAEHAALASIDKKDDRYKEIRQGLFEC